MRSKKAFLNTITSLIHEIVIIISGFIIPRLILSRFGSSYNGITSSISQFIGYVSLLTSGVGGVTMASLYKPIEEKDLNKISAIIRATEIFMRRVAMIFLVGLSLFSLIYPFLLIKEFDWVFTFSLVLILGLGTFMQYFFGITYKMLLSADQRQYIIRYIQIFTIILNTIIAVILIHTGATIHIVKLGSSLVFMLNPLIQYFYVRRHYKLNHHIEPDTSAIEQRWDAFAHQIANFVNNNTDIVILSLFSNVREISVYTVYYMVQNGLTKAVNAVTTGVEAAFGNMIAKNEDASLRRNLGILEFLVFSLCIILYTGMALLVIPFVSLYTKGITDVDYIRPAFGYLVAVAGFFYSARIPYQVVARAAGHYRQTRNGAIFEAILNISLSLGLVIPLGLIGVTIGTLAAMIFRTIQYSMYISKNIVHRSMLEMVKRFFLTGLNIFIIIFLVDLLKTPEVGSYVDWIINGFTVSIISFVVTGIFNALFYREDLVGFWNLIKRAIKI